MVLVCCLNLAEEETLHNVVCQNNDYINTLAISFSFWRKIFKKDELMEIVFWLFSVVGSVQRLPMYFGFQKHFGELETWRKASYLLFALKY